MRHRLLAPVLAAVTLCATAVTAQNAQAPIPNPGNGTAGSAVSPGMSPFVPGTGFSPYFFGYSGYPGYYNFGPNVGPMNPGLTLSQPGMGRLPVLGVNTSARPGRRVRSRVVMPGETTQVARAGSTARSRRTSRHARHRRSHRR